MRFLMFTLALIIALPSLGQAKTRYPVDSEIHGFITEVTDGDGLKVIDLNGVIHEVRLWLADSPESDQAFGKETKELLQQFIGLEVCCEVEDSYYNQRAVCLVWIEGDDNPINYFLISHGFAWLDDEYCKSHKYKGLCPRLKNLMENAKKLELGLWNVEYGQPQPVEPKVWRKMTKEEKQAYLE